MDRRCQNQQGHRPVCQRKNVLIVEDIVDTGRTIREVRRLLENKGANDVRIVSLLDKPDRRVVDIEADYVGFTVPNEFVVGYGLDFNQCYRNLPYIGVLKEEAYR
ncbi:phosphoribosyltransferase [Allobaculum sp. Allo2]|uniref:phosphoribosyltransferase n=1 Tax=Allobaculum sp. Allo2 TaxID=2853432 RepID=UPI0034630366